MPNSTAPFFSIVIPVHNRKDALRQAICSVVDQTFASFEIVVIDDGSSDFPYQAIEAVGDARVRLFRQENAGVSAARNKGIVEASGRYISFLDSDDIFLPNKLQTVHATIQSHGPDIIYSYFLVDRGISRMWLRPHRPLKQSEDVGEYFFIHGGLLHPSAMVIRAELAKRVGYDTSLPSVEDKDFVLRVNRTGARFHFIEEPLSIVNDKTVFGRLSLYRSPSPLEHWLSVNKQLMTERASIAFGSVILAHEYGWARPIRAASLLIRGFTQARIPFGRTIGLALRTYLPAATYRLIVNTAVRYLGNLREPPTAIAAFPSEHPRRGAAISEESPGHAQESGPAQRPFFSVVIPVHNRRLALVDAIQSVQKQTFQDFEIIVVDDGSSDQPEQAIQAIADPRVRLIRQDNSGASVARNAGIDAAIGRYVAFLDSDDLFRPEKLSKVHCLIEERAPDVVYSSLLVDRGVTRMWTRPSRPLYPGEDVSEYLYVHGGILQTSATVVRTDVAKLVRFRSHLRRGQDNDFALRLHKQGVTIEFVTAPLVVWNDKTAANRLSQGRLGPHLEQWLDDNHELMTLRGRVAFRSMVLTYEFGWARPLTVAWYLVRGFLYGGVSLTRTLRLTLRAYLPDPAYRWIVNSFVRLFGNAGGEPNGF